MRRVFADTHYYLALVNSDDDRHMSAVEFSESFDGAFVTTNWVLTELADALSEPPNRSLFLEMIEDLRVDPAVEVVPFSEELFRQGIDLYRERPDKSWSLTDCVSFVVMQKQGVPEALTRDHHFEQAGFIVLLK
jgi:predicted nucleic acid-binding protein